MSLIQVAYALVAATKMIQIACALVAATNMYLFYLFPGNYCVRRGDDWKSHPQLKQGSTNDIFQGPTNHEEGRKSFLVPAIGALELSPKGHLHRKREDEPTANWMQASTLAKLKFEGRGLPISQSSCSQSSCGEALKTPTVLFTCTAWAAPEKTESLSLAYLTTIPPAQGQLIQSL